MKKFKDSLLQQCEVIRQNSMYTAEAHHIIASDKSKWSFWLEVVPSIASAVAISVLVVGEQVPGWVGYVAIATAAVSAVNSVLDPKSAYYTHLNAAKLFTLLKNEAQSLKDTFSAEMTEQELHLAVEKLQSKYDAVVIATPPTDDKSFEKAQKRIKQGVHNPD
ncbi:MAG: SLATT domain-containing protein [Patescibacteria group bacterium]